MLIQLNDKFRITGILMNFVLEEKKVVSKEGDNFGKEYWDNAGYYPSIEQLLRGLLTHGLQQSECENVDLLAQEVKNAVRTIMEQIKLLEA